MFEITRGYKQGRAVLFYDIINPIDNEKKEMVSKAAIVQMCNDGKISNAKIQMWEGKPIVRVQTKELPLVKVDESGNILGVAHQAVRNTASTVTHRAVTENVVDLSHKAKVVGKLNPKKAAKQDTSYGGYDYKNIVQHQELNRSVSYSGLVTISDLFDKIANEFGLQQKELYKAEIGKKVKLSRELSGINNTEIAAIQSSIATYLMNMAHDEVNKTYIKYLIL
ncbi:MAG: hypothetical protein J6A59_18050 [Lachnospiraceae bacterium]|nr:hypothetical protein [Lachnospiraceae bacterium]